MFESLNLSVQTRLPRLDVDVSGALIKHMPVEARLEFTSIVGLDHLDGERKALEYVVHELGRGFLVQSIVNSEHSQPSAVVDRCELVVLLAGSSKRRNEFDVDLDAMPRPLLLVPLPALVESLVVLRDVRATRTTDLGRSWLA